MRTLVDGFRPYCPSRQVDEKRPIVQCAPLGRGRIVGRPDIDPRLGLFLPLVAKGLPNRSQPIGSQCAVKNPRGKAFLFQ